MYTYTKLNWLNFAIKNVKCWYTLKANQTKLNKTFSSKIIFLFIWNNNNEDYNFVNINF